MIIRYVPRLWLIACAGLGVALAFLFPDSYQQDGGQHFLFARWAWTHPALFVGVWSRPLFTFVYAFPALLGYCAAKLCTVAVCVLTAQQTWRLAHELKFARAPLAIPLLFLQPSFFIICADTMTEPIFALVYVVALRLHLLGRVKAGMLAASLLILARPEGFFLGVLWGVWGLRNWWRARNLGAGMEDLSFGIPLLAAGALLWWAAAWAITGDPLFIKHNWPTQWSSSSTSYGAGAWWSYCAKLPEIVGLFLLPPFLVGLIALLKRRRCFELTSTFLLFFGLHALMRAYGLLGSAGYARYFAAIAPAIALLTLAGWNRIAALFAHVARPVRSGCAATVLATSAFACFAYIDGAEWIRDARAVDEMHAQFSLRPQPVSRFIWSEAYMCIRFDRDPWENAVWTGHRERDLQTLRASPVGTLVMWDELYGPKWFGLKADDFEAAGYVLLRRESHALNGYVLKHSWFGFGGPRRQTLHLFYK